MNTAYGHRFGGVLATLVLLGALPAHAHFKLLAPASWLNEDPLGGPQKGSPCGPGNSRPFIGDDMQPIPASNATTTFHAGEKVTVQWQETVYHPGYYRIAVAPTRAAAATTSQFPDPPLTDEVECLYDKAAVQTGSHDSVLADGLFMVDSQEGTGRSMMQEVTLPDEPCENCTLQVMQVMEAHGASSCFYYHCADIEIVAADGGSEGASGAAGGAAPGAPGAQSSATDDDGGCSITRAGAARSTSLAWSALGLAAALGLVARRRRRRPLGRDLLRLA